MKTLLRAILMLLGIVCILGFAVCEISRSLALQDSREVYVLPVDIYGHKASYRTYSHNFQFKFDVPKELFAKYGNNFANLSRYEKFVGESFEKYKKKEKPEYFHEYMLLPFSVYIVFKPETDGTLTPQCYTFKRPDNGIYLQCKNPQIRYSGNKDIILYCPFSRFLFPYSESEIKIFKEKIQACRKKNKDFTAKGLAYFKYCSGRVFVTDYSLAGEKFSEILKSKKPSE